MYFKMDLWFVLFIFLFLFLCRYVIETLLFHVLGHSGVIPSNEECGIRDVWAHNLKDEFRVIRSVIRQYNYVAMVSTVK